MLLSKELLVLLTGVSNEDSCILALALLRDSGGVNSVVELSRCELKEEKSWTVGVLLNRLEDFRPQVSTDFAKLLLVINSFSIADIFSWEVTWHYTSRDDLCQFSVLAFNR